MGLAPERRVWIRPSATVRLPAGVALCLLASLPGAAVAQTVTGALPPTREEVTRPDTQVRRDQALRLEIEGGIERAPCALDNPEFKDIRFTLRGAEFDGLRQVRPDELARSYSALVGTEQPIPSSARFATERRPSFATPAISLRSRCLSKGSPTESFASGW